MCTRAKHGDSDGVSHFSTWRGKRLRDSWEVLRDCILGLKSGGQLGVWIVEVYTQEQVARLTWSTVPVDCWCHDEAIASLAATWRLSWNSRSAPLHMGHQWLALIPRSQGGVTHFSQNPMISVDGLRLFFFQFCCLFLLVCFACKLDTWVSLYFLRIHVFWARPNGLAVKEFIFFLLPQWDHSFCYGARLGCSYKQASVQPFSAETWASILDFSSSPSAPVEVRQMLQQSYYSVWSTWPKRLGENQVLAFFGCVAQKSRGFSTSEKSVTQHLLHSYCEEIIIIFVIVDVLLLLGRL